MINYPFPVSTNKKETEQPIRIPGEQETASVSAWCGQEVPAYPVLFWYLPLNQSSLFAKPTYSSSLGENN